MVQSGVIIPDENLEDHVRMVADLPERDPATSYAYSADATDAPPKGE